MTSKTFPEANLLIITLKEDIFGNKVSEKLFLDMLSNSEKPSFVYHWSMIMLVPNVEVGSDSIEGSVYFYNSFFRKSIPIVYNKEFLKKQVSAEDCKAFYPVDPVLKTGLEYLDTFGFEVTLGSKRTSKV